jgi:protein involved in ribonucleotide reduction
LSRFLIDHDRVSGMSSHFEYDAGTDMYLLRNSQDVSGIVEANKREFNDAPRRHGDGIGRKVASIPLNIWFELRKQGITRDRKAFKRWLNDSDNRVFRTSPGTV